MPSPPPDDTDVGRPQQESRRRRRRIGALLGFPLSFVRSRSGMTRGDVAIAAAGLALGVTCALFPWYIFFNQEKFGPPSVTFSGSEVEAVDDAGGASPVLPRGNAEVRIIGIPNLDLDFSPTGTVPRPFSPPSDTVPEQPFPDGDGTPFRVLHITAGRAMIEDDTGIWVVQPGATLPDRSKIDRIERRADGSWVVVTGGGKVLEPSQ